MYTRVSTFEGPAERIEEFVSDAGGKIAQLRNLPGFLGLEVLVDRQSGKILTITRWDTAKHVHETTAVADRMRAEGIDPDRGDRPPSYEVFEVALHHDNAVAETAAR